MMLDMADVARFSKLQKLAKDKWVRLSCFNVDDIHFLVDQIDKRDAFLAEFRPVGKLLCEAHINIGGGADYFLCNTAGLIIFYAIQRLNFSNTITMI